MFEERTYTVSDFNRMIKGYIEENPNLREFFLEGELSGVTYYKSGHLYFNLKDNEAQIKCVAFKYKFKRIAEDLKDGDSVKLFGDVGFYENKGDFQVLVRHIEKKNKLGDMFAKLEELKKMMEKRGYFSSLYKKELPRYPRNIGVVTAITGAAVQDIIKTIKKRDNTINIYVYPAKVQGSGASDEIVRGIEKLNEIPEIDLIIAGRGGGSIEDLWAFNEEKTAMAFFNSKKPIISAVGHEIDNLLTDLVADVRAATPTQAVEISVPERKKTLESLEDRERYIVALMKNILSNKKKELEVRKESYYLKNFSKLIEEKNRLLMERESRLLRAIDYYLNIKKNQLENKIQRLITLNPLKILERGYSVVTKEGMGVKTISDINIGDEIEVRINDGKIISKVEKIVKN
ncbi:exodeoxyribonuclease VII large subunit [uncultured Fusobacterium sp.]|uniref:exodeoxyribonuclease VII large subunit n=1 Tax=uncultured Fusobacterium sp. TaxID=159267 RepID=UPI0025F1F29D|nr:exodeoxyribonuclease VII large subunit [uncultured Fusobacterium sp.]